MKPFSGVDKKWAEHGELSRMLSADEYYLIPAEWNKKTQKAAARDAAAKEKGKNSAE